MTKRKKIDAASKQSEAQIRSSGKSPSSASSSGKLSLSRSQKKKLLRKPGVLSYTKRNHAAWHCVVGNTLERLLIAAFARLSHSETGVFVLDMAKTSARCLASESDIFDAVLSLQRSGHITIFSEDNIQKILIHPTVSSDPVKAGASSPGGNRVV